MEIVVILMLLLLCIYLVYKIYKTEKALGTKFNDYVKDRIKEVEDTINNKREELERRYGEQKSNYDKQIDLMNSFIEQTDKQREDTIKKNKEILIVTLNKYQEEELRKIKAEDDARRLKADEDFKLVVFNKQKEKEKLQEEVELVKKELEDFRLRRAATNEAIRRERELSEKEDFYKIQLTSEDIDDIELLKTMTARLQHKELIPKLIWSALVQRPTTEMIKRVTGGKAISGIYKITYIPTGEAYIGKTTDIKTRWQNHIGTAIGLEKAASSTLHTHMARHGIQNYTFEILEEVEKDKLGEREKFYIELYGTVEQLNMKAGG